jgi:hypothetical protein
LPQAVGNGVSAWNGFPGVVPIAFGLVAYNITNRSWIKNIPLLIWPRVPLEPLVIANQDGKFYPASLKNFVA